MTVSSGLRFKLLGPGVWGSSSLGFRIQAWLRLLGLSFALSLHWFFKVWAFYAVEAGQMVCGFTAIGFRVGRF